MPRKKSAAKKSKEAEPTNDVPIQDSLFADVDEVGDQGFTINEEYAKRFEHNKKREDLHRLQEKYKDAVLNGDDEEEDSTSEEEDDVGDLNTPQIDSAILKLLAKIKNKDEDLYTTEIKFFEEAEKAASTTLATKNKTRQIKPTRIADVHRETILAGKANADYNGQDSEEDMEMEEPLTHTEEQDALRNAFHGVGDEADSDDDVLVPRKRTSEEAKEEEDRYQAFLKEQLENGTGEDLLNRLKKDNAENPEGEEFLMNYVLKRGWIDKDADKVPSYDQIVDSDEEFADWEERAEKFETNYNFRFEQPGATEITTHPRDVQSVRRKDEKRKKEREVKLSKAESAKQERLEELNRLRNLKKAEFEKKIRKIEEVTGRPMDFDQLDLEGDFDPDQWDKKMLDHFNDEYYREEEKKPSWDDDIDIADLGIPEDQSDAAANPPDDDVDASGDALSPSSPFSSTIKKTSTKPTKREEKSRKRKLEALVDAAVPESLGPSGRHFRYRQSEPESFGLSIEDILFADDAQLNEFVGLKKLAAFKPVEKRELDRKKYGSKKRVKQFQKTLWSQSQWASGRTGANEIDVGEGRGGGGDRGRGSRKKSKKEEKA